MRGKIVAKAVKPMGQEYTISITLPLSDWKTLADGITGSEYPKWHVVQAILDAIGHAENHFVSEIKSE